MHNHFQLLNLQYNSTFADIKELDKLLQICREFRPEIIFHLAAQPIVFDSYREPVRTFADNVMGTVNILECARQTPSVRGVVAVTSDKCYDVKNPGRHSPKMPRWEDSTHTAHPRRAPKSPSPPIATRSA